ncbi:MAG: hypothetical protein JSS32_04500 [Verrucomicrobia bacterium]|nr:hypothetical protein [Verrucomicrobiota bacterium]
MLRSVANSFKTAISNAPVRTVTTCPLAKRIKESAFAKPAVSDWIVKDVKNLGNGKAACACANQASKLVSVWNVNTQEDVKICSRLAGHILSPANQTIAKELFKLEQNPNMILSAELIEWATEKGTLRPEERDFYLTPRIFSAEDAARIVWINELILMDRCWTLEQSLRYLEEDPENRSASRTLIDQAFSEGRISLLGQHTYHSFWNKRELTIDERVQRDIMNGCILSNIPEQAL